MQRSSFRSEKLASTKSYQSRPKKSFRSNNEEKPAGEFDRPNKFKPRATKPGEKRKPQEGFFSKPIKKDGPKETPNERRIRYAKRGAGNEKYNHYLK